MWICPNCGIENDYQFCTECGTPESQMEEKSMEYTDNTFEEAHKSPEITETTETHEAYEPVAMPILQKKNNSLIIICCALGLIGLVLIVLLLMLLFGGSSFTVSNLHTISKPTSVAIKEPSSVSTTGTTPTPAPTNVPTTTPAPSGRWMDTNREAFLEKIRKDLGVPDNLNVTAEVGDIVYWEGADTYIVRVSFLHNGEIVASASVDPNTGELARSIIAYIAPSKAPAATSYKLLTNSRFGFSIEYPSMITVINHAQNGAGSSLTTPDGSVSMQVYGDHMAEFGTTPSLTELYEEYKNRASYNIGYQVKKNNWFVLSGELGSTIYYEKHFLKSDGTHNWFLIAYPKSREKEFDPIIGHLVDTFRTGKGADSPTEK